MAVPSGATSVKYSGFYYNGDVEHPGVPHIEFIWSQEAEFYSQDAGELWDAALAAAFLAFDSVIKGVSPDVPGSLTRAYSGPVAGTPFPPAP